MGVYEEKISVFQTLDHSLKDVRSVHLHSKAKPGHKATYLTESSWEHWFIRRLINTNLFSRMQFSLKEAQITLLRESKACLTQLTPRDLNSFAFSAVGLWHFKAALQQMQSCPTLNLNQRKYLLFVHIKLNTPGRECTVSLCPTV